MNPIFENNEAIKFVVTEEGRYNLGDEGRIESSYLKDGEYYYVVKSAGISIPEVPEAVMEAVYSGIEKNVDSYLRSNESERKFQDSDVRIGGTRKEMAAFKGLIKLSDLSNIEADSVTAENLIKKDKVYPKVNYNEEKENGVSGGTIYLKDKLRESVIAKPINNKDIRAMYVGLIQWLVEVISDAKDINTLKLKFDYFYKGSLRKSILIANPDLEPELLREKEEHDEFANKIHEFRQKRDEYNAIKQRLHRENVNLNYFKVIELEEFKEADKQYSYWERMYKLADRYKDYQILPIEYKFLQEIIVKDSKKGNINLLTQKTTKSDYSNEDYLLMYGSSVKNNLLQTVLGDKFYDFIKERTSREFVEKAYYQAELYDPYTQTQYDIDYESIIKPAEIKLQKYKDWVSFLSDETKPLRERVEYAHKNTDMTNWYQGSKNNTFESLYKKGRVDEMAQFIKRMITSDWGYLKNIESYKKRLSEYEIRYKIRGNDYTWFEKVDSEEDKSKTKERTELVVNTATPLSYIKRIGGIAVFDEDLDSGEKLLSFYKQYLGITRITYGKTLPDNERMAHSKHFFASIIDLAETLNWDVKKLISLGGLGIMFAAAGRGGAMAHYDPQRIALNLTRGKGDGTVAHEMAHYIDNMLAKIYPKDNESEKRHSVFGSYVKERELRYGQISITQNISNQNIYSAMKTLMLFIKKGVPIDLAGNLNISEEAKLNPTMQKMIPLMPEFIQSMMASEITITIEGSHESASRKSILRYKHGETVEDEIKYYQTNNPDYFSYNQYLSEKKVRDLFVAIANTYKVDSYQLTLNNKPKRRYGSTSSYTNTNFYLKNSMMKSDYWTFEWELFARGFETYIFDKINKFGRENNYLVSGGYFNRPEGVYAFGIEREILYILYDHLFDVIKSEMQIPDFVPFRTQRINEYIELNNDDTAKRKVISDEATSAIIELTNEQLERKLLISNKLESLLGLLNKNTNKFADGGELIKFDLIKNLFNFAENGVIN